MERVMIGAEILIAVVKLSYEERPLLRGGRGSVAPLEVNVRLRDDAGYLKR